MLQNIIGTGLVIIGVIILSSSKPAKGQWRKLDIIYPILGALAFGISTTLRKTGLMDSPDSNSCGGGHNRHRLFLFCWLSFKCGEDARRSSLIGKAAAGCSAAALVNTGAILSVFSALNIGNVVKVEPLIACNPLLTIVWTGIFLKEIEQISAHTVVGALVTVTGTVLVATVK